MNKVGFLVGLIKFSIAFTSEDVNEWLFSLWRRITTTVG
jgi:hypothetical protein